MSKLLIDRLIESEKIEMIVCYDSVEKQDLGSTGAVHTLHMEVSSECFEKVELRFVVGAVTPEDYILYGLLIPYAKDIEGFVQLDVPISEEDKIRVLSNVLSRIEIPLHQLLC